MQTGWCCPHISYMEVSKEILNDIADSLEAGFKCYIHKETHEVITFPDEDRFTDMDQEPWQDDIDKVFDNHEKYIEIENMNSSESFRVMEDFVHSMENNSMKIRLLQAIEGLKPFGNFKHQIENSGDYRELWFTFRRNKNIDWVQNQLSSGLH